MMNASVLNTVREAITLAQARHHAGDAPTFDAALASVIDDELAKAPKAAASNGNGHTAPRRKKK